MADWPASLRSSRLALRRRRASDPAPDWLTEAERAVLGADPGCPLPPAVEAGEVAYWIRMKPEGDPDSITVGSCALRIERQDLVWCWLAVGESWRAFGYGGAAVPVVERAARRLGARASRVRVPSTNGVSLYFRLRLGYRPLRQSGWDEPYPGTWMSRSV